ncbi:MAG: hypothetical protein KF764_16105 [Labilithrix sp.]|nr:hypothetical protein [Labilithrix sp.]
MTKFKPFRALFLATWSVTVACGGLAVDQADDQGESATGAKSATSKGSTPSRAGDDDSAAAPPECEGGDHVYSPNGDGGVAGTMRSRCASVTVDGTKCLLDEEGAGLDLGLAGHGWTVNAMMSCFGGSILTLSGVDDAPYPQTAVRPFLSESSAWFAAGGEASDGGASDGTYSSDPSGSSTIERGPVATNGERTVGVIRGTARVVAENGASRDIEFYFAF